MTWNYSCNNVTNELYKLKSKKMKLVLRKFNRIGKALKIHAKCMRFLEWNSCPLCSPRGERENGCALQYASLVISNLSTSCDVPAGT